MKKAAADGEATRFASADVNGDDVINDNDLALLRKFILGEIRSF